MHDIVVIGTSAGGVAALRQLVAGLPDGYGGAIFVVMHIHAEADSVLHEILGRSGRLPVQRAGDGMPIQAGTLLVAPPDCHLLVTPGRVRVVRGPHENRHRPAIDPLFRSAAWAYGPRVVGVVLTGHLDDGTAGLWAVKSCGGTTVVQDPEEAEHPGMPASALRHNEVDHCLPLDEIGPLLGRLALTPVEPGARPEPPATLQDEIGFTRLERGLGNAGPPGTPTPFTCPTCRGALWELDEGGHLRYRCHTGHAFSQDSLVLDQGLDIERSLYMALRSMEEKAAALRRLSERWAERFPRMREDYEDRARELEASAEVLRGLLAGTPM